jgi:hypothetical protein
LVPINISIDRANIPKKDEIFFPYHHTKHMYYVECFFLDWLASDLPLSFFFGRGGDGGGLC